MRTSDALWIVTLVFAVAIGTALVTRPPLPPDETRYLTVAWEMWRGGDLLVPHLNGATYSHKPPLLFWLINLAWVVFGVSEPAARLVPPLFALGSAWLTAALATLLWPERAGLPGVAALLIAGTAVFLLFGSLAMFDAALTFFTLTGLTATALVWRRRDGRFWWLYGVALGLAVLTKGPVALLHMLPAPLLAPLCLRAAAPSSWRRWYVGLAGAVALGAALALALAWAVPAAVAGGDSYRDQIFWSQSAGRVTNAIAHARLWWFYLAVLPLLLAPWIGWPRLWRALGHSRLATFDDGLRLCLAWFGAGVLVLSAISGKQVHYLLPLLPAFALAGARLVVGATDATGGPSASGAAGRTVTVTQRQAAGMAGGVALLFVLIHLAGAMLVFERYDVRPLAAFLAGQEADGLAVVGRYQGEFGFAGRLEGQLKELRRPQVGQWMARHPDGHVIARFRDGAPRQLDWPPTFTMAYRGTNLGVWRSRPDQKDPESPELDLAIGQ